MSDDGKQARGGESFEGEVPPERPERGLSDRVRRAMAAGLEVASRSKDDLLRAATSELGSWLERIDVTSELAKVLGKMVVEVKAEIRFRPREDGTLAPEVTGDVKTKPEPKP
jgi:hypothetical protein